jgi:hypothetical protein
MIQCRGRIVRLVYEENIVEYGHDMCWKQHEMLADIGKSWCNYVNNITKTLLHDK